MIESLTLKIYYNEKAERKKGKNRQPENGTTDDQQNGTSNRRNGRKGPKNQIPEMASHLDQGITICGNDPFHHFDLRHS